MNWFDNLTLRAKLFLGFGICGAVLTLAVIFCLVEIRLVKGNVDTLTGDTVPSLRVAGEISQLRLRYRVRSLEYMMASADEQEKMAKSMADLDEKLKAALTHYETLTSSEEERRILKEAGLAADEYRDAVNEAVVLLRNGKHEEAQALRKTKWVKAANRVRDQTDNLAKLNSEGAVATSAAAGAAVSSATTGGLLALAVGVTLTLIISTLIAARISARVRDAVSLAERIADGDLQKTPIAESRDEIGKLLQAMDQMRQSLRDAILRIRSAAETISTSSTELAASSSSMRESTNVQSESASAIAANVEQLTVSINHVTEVTRESAALASDSDSQAGLGRNATEQLIEQMGRVAEVVNSTAKQISTLEAESEKIAQVVSVIKDIADQTNLLALNAAIEAARAGEQGRGFAVVADEVRTLSERTANSTREISDTVVSIRTAIAEVVSEVAEGVRLSDEGIAKAGATGEAIVRMQEITHRVASLVSDIDSSLREQSVAATDVAQKVEKISVHAEETSNASGETSAAAEQLDRIAQEMQAAVSGFRV